ncbi:MAG: glycerate kinase, partial [Deltaproteobacteria bacterium CG_4_9_14_3_um_filter_44_9]
MKGTPLKQMRSEAEAIFRHCLKAVDPYMAVKRFLRLDGKKLILGSKDRPLSEFDLNGYDRIFIVGGGKATAPMAR